MTGRIGHRGTIAAVVAAVIVAGAIILSAYVHGQGQLKSLYARLGGYDAIAAVTDDFVGRLCRRPTA
jgi:hypothetical protein